MNKTTKENIILLMHKQKSKTNINHNHKIVPKDNYNKEYNIIINNINNEKKRMLKIKI